jgi:streptogrisin C
VSGRPAVDVEKGKTLKKSMRNVVLGAAVAAAVVGMAGASGAAVGGSGSATVDKPVQESTPVAPEGNPVTAAARAYRTVYPSMSRAEARRAARQQDQRKVLQRRLISGPRAASFGGSWFDPPTGTVHVAVTTRAARRSAVRTADRLGLKVTTHKVARSFAQLERRATALRESDSALGRAAAGNVGIDVKRNAIVVGVRKARLTNLRATSATGSRLVRKRNTNVEADAACTARNTCDYTIRAGNIMWRNNTSIPWCSVGFTGRQTNNQRWVYTAGHCSTGNGVTWGTGTRPIGTMYASIDSGVYDASIIQVTNSWFASDQGGEIYNTVYVNGVAPTLSYLQAGETVCLSANFTNPSGGNSCGVINTTSDGATRGMVRVDGLDACGGDSGGGWYWLTSTGRRIAYGLHSRSDLGCHGDQGGSHSWFSPLPTVKTNWTPWLNVETRP